VRALPVTDWIRLPADDDLDFVGPVATDVLRRHGLLHPANAYFHAPLLREAAGGTLLTGVGGDQVLGDSYPDAVLRHRLKARFTEVFWRRHTRAMLAGWDGSGLDPSVVDRARLRLEWDRPQPDLCTAMLVQQVWLARAVPLLEGPPK
jgi:asparagine synthase (glutamine-hydrolysing)